MLNLLKKAALLLLMFSLPLQSLHAFSMMLCNQDDQISTIQQSSVHEDIAAHDGDHQAADIKLTCNGCGMFHNCSAPAIASNILDIALDIIATPQATTSSSIMLFIPEQPQRPPRA